MNQFTTLGGCIRNENGYECQPPKSKWMCKGVRGRWPYLLQVKMFDVPPAVGLLVFTSLVSVCGRGRAVGEMRIQLFDLRQIILLQTTALLITPALFYTAKIHCYKKLILYMILMWKITCILYRRKQKVSVDPLVIKSPPEIYTAS